MLTGCQNPHGCRKTAVKTVKIIDKGTGDTVDERDMCAYCADDVDTPAAYRVEIEDGVEQ